MIVKMNRITLLGMEDQRESLISSLMEFGAVEISDVSGEEYKEIAMHPRVQEELFHIDSKLSDIQAALEGLEKFCPAKKALFQSRRRISGQEFDNILKKQDEIWEVVESIKEYEQKLVDLKTEENRLENLHQSLLPWKGMGIPLEFTGTKKTGFLLGTIPSTILFDLIEQELQQKVPCTQINLVNSDRDLHYINLIYHREVEQECISYLKTRGLNRIVFPNIIGTVEENLAYIKKHTVQMNEQRDVIINKVKGMQDFRSSLEVLYDAVGMEKGRTEAMEKVLKTRKVFMIKGWVPENFANQAKELLESKYTVSVDIQKPEDDEEFPVLLENRGMAEAVEPVLTMYGLPNSREIDPNKVMAPFFILFFGLMLSDGGYGIIMSLLAGFVLWRFKLEDSTRKFMKLMLFCGLSTMFWGAMFGGWFGIEALVPYAIWFNMVEDPELMLSWSLLFGIIHMFVGIGVRAANLIRKKKYLDALFDAGFWYILFTGFAFYLLPFVPKVDQVKAAPLVEVGKYMLIIGAALLILTQGRDKKSIIGKFFGGISSLYDLISYLSDVLSYSRLLALGLATSIIASIVNQMSVMFDLPIVIKIVLAIMILLVGHMINFAINALGAYVHSCRLQYLEFFGKFFKGGGEAFNPLKANTKYIYVKTDAAN